MDMSNLLSSLNYWRYSLAVPMAGTVIRTGVKRVNRRLDGCRPVIAIKFARCRQLPVAISSHRRCLQPSTAYCQEGGKPSSKTIVQFDLASIYYSRWFPIVLRLATAIFPGRRLRRRPRLHFAANIKRFYEPHFTDFVRIRRIQY